MDELVDRLDGLVHEPTQVREDGRVDLTVREISTVSDPGRLDFGGGELTAPETRAVPTTRRNPDDEYRWWQLGAGTYLVSFNESLREGDPVRIQPRRELLECGGSHPTVETEQLDPIPLTVGGAGLNIKANARVSTASRP